MKRPYIGPRPFDWHDEEDAQRFFGRDAEASELRFRVHANPVLVLYALAGAGKTSLLHAKLAPDLTEKDSFCVLPPLRPRTMYEAEDTTDPTNRSCARSLLRSWTQLANDSEQPAAIFPKFLADRLRSPSPVPDNFLDLFADAPEKLQFVVIFDQFDEFFSTALFAKDQQKLFFAEIADCVRRYASLRFVFAMRSESLALFDHCATPIPTPMRSRFYLEQLKSTAAEDAIMRPVELFDWTFDQLAARKLVRALRSRREEVSPSKFETVEGEYIEPVQLQIVCQDIWQRVQVTKADKKVIEESDIGSVDDPLGDYYAKAVAHTARVTRLKEWRIRGWVQRNLITEARTRGKVFRGERLAAGITNQVIDELAKARLIRRERQSGSWYELVHDSFIVPILESNLIWRTQLSGAELFAEELGLRAYAKEPLLNEVELSQAKILLEGEGAVSDESHDKILELVSKSEAELTRQANEREQRVRDQERLQKAREALQRLRQRWVLGVGVALVLLLGTGGFYYVKDRERDAETREKNAEILSMQRREQYRRLQRLVETSFSYLGVANRGFKTDLGMLTAVDSVAEYRLTQQFVSPRAVLALALANAYKDDPVLNPSSATSETFQKIYSQIPCVESVDRDKQLVVTSPKTVELRTIENKTPTSFSVAKKITELGFDLTAERFGVRLEDSKVIIWQLRREGAPGTLPTFDQAEYENVSLATELKVSDKAEGQTWFRTGPKEGWNGGYDRIVDSQLLAGIGRVTRPYSEDERREIGISTGISDEIDAAYRMVEDQNLDGAISRLKEIFAKVGIQPDSATMPDSATIKDILLTNLFDRAVNEKDQIARENRFQLIRSLNPKPPLVSQIDKFTNENTIKDIMERGNSFARKGETAKAIEAYEEALKKDPTLNVNPNEEWKKFAPPSVQSQPDGQ